MTHAVIDRDSPVAAWGQVMRDLRARIDRGDLAAGSRLPNEVELAAAYGVSRITMRQALASLANEGYIERRHGSGTFVGVGVTAVQHDLRLTTPWRDRVRAVGHDARSEFLEGKRATPPPAVLRALGVPEWTTGQAVYFKRRQLVDGRAIGLSESWLPDRFTGLLGEPLVDDSVSATLAARYGITIHRVHNVLDVTLLGTAESALLQTYTDAPAFVVSAAVRERDDALIEVSRTLWVSSRVHFKYDSDETPA